MKRFLVRHLGNMGDMIFFIPPVLATLKKHYPHCHITFVTVWGFKAKGFSLSERKRAKGFSLSERKRAKGFSLSERKRVKGFSLSERKRVKGFSLSERKRAEGWGKRNQDGFCIALMATNPHVDQLVHWHDTKLSLDGKICWEESQSFPTWNKKYYEQQKNSGRYDKVFELDFGLQINDNPLQRMYEAIGLPDETYFEYKLYFTEHDLEVARAVIGQAPRPRLVLLEGLASTTTRGWDPGKIPSLEQAIKKTYGVSPIWFGSKYIPDYHGRPLTLRENIATLTCCDVGIGVPSGPLHLAAAAGLPTLTLYCDHPRQRAAPAYFLNKYIADPRRWHRTLMGPTTEPMKLLKNDQPALALIPAEVSQQQFKNWNKPGQQSTKTCLSVITVDEIMLVLKDMLL